MIWVLETDLQVLGQEKQPIKFLWGLRRVYIQEPEHGLAVKFEDKEVVEVGYQDIIYKLIILKDRFFKSLQKM